MLPDATEPPLTDTSAMERPRQLQLWLVLEPDREPIKGSLAGRQGPRRDFEGWMQLAAVLEELMARGDATGDRRFDQV